ncbi:MAG: 4Fe-4S binding protein [Deferrisomatales bacterium]|nr:4Fe-4S binding protein [Deferrisomatales bacterium]
MEAVTHYVAYLSPTGRTRQVARVVAAALRARGGAVETLDLGGEGRGTDPAEWMAGARDRVCVWVGSPVYAHHPIPQVQRFVGGLPVFPNGRAVPFVTWGSVTSGMALWDLGAGLAARGYGLLGAAAVPAVHCTFWRSAAPLGAGRPHREDLAQVESLVAGVLEKLRTGGGFLDPAVLDYQPPAVRVVSEGASLEKAKARMPPRAVLEARCTRCGACEAACPVGAVALDPYPVFDATCTLCNECVRACPEEAIPFDAEAAMTRIRGLQAQFQETPAPRVFR